MTKTAMFFGAHADDMEIRAAGTLARLKAQGYRVVSVMMTNNICGAYVDDETEEYFSTGPLDTQAIRHREAEAAAEVLGVEMVYLDYRENSYFDGEKRVYFGTPEYDLSVAPGKEPLVTAQYLAPCIADVARLLAEYAPEIVMTHSVGNCNPEHCAAGHLTFTAFQWAKAEAGLGELWMTTRVQSAGDVLHLDPDVLVDITPYRDLKVQAMECHRSQRLPFERIRQTDEYWGRVAGAAFAEPFRTVARGV